MQPIPIRRCEMISCLLPHARFEVGSDGVSRGTSNPFATPEIASPDAAKTIYRPRAGEKLLNIIEQARDIEPAPHTLTGARGSRPQMMSAAFSAIMMTGA